MHFLQCRFDSFTLKPSIQLGLGVAGVLAADAAGAGVEAFPPKILNITVPHVGHLPLMALRPFFITSSTASTISFFALHLTQYPSRIKFSHAGSFMQRRSHSQSLGGAFTTVNWETAMANLASFPA